LNKYVILHVYDSIHFLHYDTIIEIQIIYIKKQNVNSLLPQSVSLKKS